MISGWIKQIDKAYNAEPLVCPVCQSENTEAKFYVFKDGVGYCDFECHDCNEKEHFSRIKYPEGIKLQPIQIDS